MVNVIIIFFSVIKIKRNKVNVPTKSTLKCHKDNETRDGICKQIKRKQESNEFDHKIRTVLHPKKKSRIEIFTSNAENSQNKQKRKLNDDKVEMK